MEASTGTFSPLKGEGRVGVDTTLPLPPPIKGGGNGICPSGEQGGGNRVRTSDGQALYLIGAGQAGFTLIEVIIVVILTGILGSYTFYILSGSTRTFATMATRKERADDAVLALDKISREVRDAKTVTSPPDTAEVSTLTFTKKNASGNDTSTSITYTLVTDSSAFIISSSGNELQRQSGAGTSVVAKNVSSFAVSKDASNRIVIKLAFSSGSSWQTKVSIRNSGL
jgi:prepilin-type N-terminal cleavage/methylation domain-containing protein